MGSTRRYRSLLERGLYLATSIGSGKLVRATVLSRERRFYMKRVCIYEMKDGSEQVSRENYSRAEDEQHERAAMEKEIRDPQSYVQGFRFKWVDDKEEKR
jgi:hypothetical protein